jgi:hypothetical protein
MHGNNKSMAEIEAAIAGGVGRIVIDSFDEIVRVADAASRAGVVQPVLVRVTVGVEAHTHEFIATAHEDQKFGLSISSGVADEAVRRIVKLPSLEFAGIHSHIGSHIFDAAGFKKWWDGVKKKMKADGHFQIPSKKSDPFVLLDVAVNPGRGFIDQFREARHTKDQVAALDQITKALGDLADEVEELKSLAAQIEDTAQKGRKLQSAAAVEMLLVRDEILDLLQGLTTSLGLTLIMVSHDLSVIARLCDTVIVMQDGVAVERGRTADVFSRPSHPFTMNLIAAVPRLPGS